MLDLLIGAAVNFGVSSVMSNAATKLIISSGKKTLDKVGIGFGTLILTEMITDVTTKHYVKKANDIIYGKDQIKYVEKSEDAVVEKENKEVEDGRKVSK